MRRARTLIILFLILIVGLAVAYFGIRALQQYLTPPAPPPVNVQVFIAGQNIPQGAQITEDTLATIEIPADRVNAVEFTVDRKGQLVNKIAKYPIDQGVVITSSMVADSSQAVSIAGPQWAALIPPGMTAASIPASRLSLDAYGINDGAHVNLNACFLFVDLDAGFQTISPDHVSVLTSPGTLEKSLPVLSLTVGNGSAAQGRLEAEPSLAGAVPYFYYLTPSEADGQRPRPVCQTILQDAVVLKLGNFPLPQALAASAQQQQNAPPPAPDIVTLIVSPQDAVTLTYMIYTNAKITMTLRNPGDESRLATEAATLQFLLSQYNVPVPAKLPYALQPRMDALSAPALPNDAPAP